MSFSWLEDADGRALYCDTRRIVTLAPFVSGQNEGRIQYHDEVMQVMPGVFRWTRRFQLASGEAAQSVRLTMQAMTAYHASYLLIPAILYNGNHWGTGHEPKGFMQDNVPRSFAWHRSAIPGATYSEGDGWSVALFSMVPQPGQACSCALEPREDSTIHHLIWQEEELPDVYSDRDYYSPGLQAPFWLKPGEEFVGVAYLVVTAVEEERRSWEKLLTTAWQQNYHQTEVWFSSERLWTLGIRFAKESLWVEEGDFRGFSIGLLWQPEAAGWQQRQQHKYEIGWAGQNAALAVALLEDFLRTGDDDSRQRGLAALDCWVTYAILPNGLIRCHFDPILSEGSASSDLLYYSEQRSEECQDACNLGGAAQTFFEAAELVEDCGVERPRYKEVALALCEFVLATQRNDGCLGRVWANDGTLLDWEGTIGAFLLMPLITAYRVTGESRYLLGAERGYAYYSATLRDNGYTTAGALDTHCIDKESAVPLLDAGLALYDLTENPQYLTDALRAGYYLASWQWCYTVAYPENSVLGQLGYDTLGGTAVSTQHHHLDPYAIACVPGWLRLSALTGEEQWRQRALTAWNHGTAGISDGTLSLLGKLRPQGSQDEGAFHTRWRDYGSVSEWLVAWPTAFRLTVLRTLKNDPEWLSLNE